MTWRVAIRDTSEIAWKRRSCRVWHVAYVVGSKQDSWRSFVRLFRSIVWLTTWSFIVFVFIFSLYCSYIQWILNTQGISTYLYKRIIYYSVFTNGSIPGNYSHIRTTAGESNSLIQQISRPPRHNAQSRQEVLQHKLTNGASWTLPGCDTSWCGRRRRFAEPSHSTCLDEGHCLVGDSPLSSCFDSKGLLGANRSFPLDEFPGPIREALKRLT